ncbi:MAG TPA: hypothetical protein VLA12_14535, partial [Planctomycetaceae bacterium]|nr:hypothetical protein [Planctomycetaceae bacterium]
MLADNRTELNKGDACVWKLSLSVCLALFSIGELNAEPIRWTVGVATVDITPDYPVRLNGFGFRREESEGVRQRIHAKALAIGNSDE